MILADDIYALMILKITDLTTNSTRSCICKEQYCRRFERNNNQFYHSTNSQGIVC